MFRVTDSKLNECLLAHGIRSTKTRRVILRLLYEQQAAISVPKVIAISPIPLDRVSIFRCMKLFAERNIVSMAPSLKGEMQYMLSAGCYLREKREGPEGYFICVTCGTTEYILAPVLASPKEPPNKKFLRYRLIVEGYCEHCKTTG